MKSKSEGFNGRVFFKCLFVLLIFLVKIKLYRFSGWGSRFCFFMGGGRIVDIFIIGNNIKVKLLDDIIYFSIFDVF